MTAHSSPVAILAALVAVPAVCVWIPPPVAAGSPGRRPGAFSVACRRIPAPMAAAAFLVAAGAFLVAAGGPGEDPAGESPVEVKTMARIRVTS